MFEVTYVNANSAMVTYSGQSIERARSVLWEHPDSAMYLCTRTPGTDRLRRELLESRGMFSVSSTVWGN